MNKHLKTLLLISMISLPISACSTMSGKTDAASAVQPCKMMKHVEAASASADNVVKELNDALADTTNAKKKKKLQKLIKEAGVLSKDLTKSKKMCDVKMDDADKKAPATKKVSKKAKAAVAPASTSMAPAAAADKK